MPKDINEFAEEAKAEEKIENLKATINRLHSQLEKEKDNKEHQDSHHK